MNPTSIIFVAALLGVSLASVRYDNFSLYRIVPRNAKDVEILKSLQILERASFWTEPKATGVFVDILLAPKQKGYVKQLLIRNEMDFEVVIENIQERIDAEVTATKRYADDGDITWDAYYDLDQIYNWLRKLADDNPDKVTLLEGGSTYENRTILGVKVSFGSQNENKGVWIDSNIHAREWISSAVSTFILNAVLHSDDPSVRSIAESHDWYIFPVINPDGFVYSHTSDRFWRGNRAPSSASCVGIDLNRNWDYAWESSFSPCSETYSGTAPFSEIESRSLSEFQSTIGNKLELLLSFHSYSQLILLPYGDSYQHLDNYNVTYPIGLKAAQSLATRYGTEFEVGTPPDILYEANGISMDWAKKNLQIPFVYTYELRDTGRYGFVLPPEQIIPSALETLDSIVTILQEADKTY